MTWNIYNLSFPCNFLPTCYLALYNNMDTPAGTDRSISTGNLLPQWMRTKIGDRYDLDQASFSPPSEDDSFFFIRYPKISQAEYKTSLNVPKEGASPLKRSSTAPGKDLKSMGMDDDSSDYGRSVVAVAHNMINNKMFGYHLAEKPPTVSENGYNRNQRRNSKSLPASPQTSPKFRRKNPYFSDPFRKSNDNFGKSGWLLANILSQRKSIEDLASGTESAVSSETDSPSMKRRNYEQHDRIHILGNDPKPKPTELREMNFWSPTSM